MNSRLKFDLVRSINESDWIFVTYSSVEIFDVLFPFGDHQLIISIRDKRDCVTQWNLTTVSVQPDSIDLTDLLVSSSSNPVQQLLTNGNPTTKTQVMNIISYEMNQNNAEFIQNASSSQLRRGHQLLMFYFLLHRIF